MTDSHPLSAPALPDSIWAVPTDIVVGVYENPPPKRPNPIFGLVKKPMMLAIAGGAVALLLVLGCCCGLWVFGNLNTGSV
ncbi:hypothetical protein [Catellatospora sp. NPDC049609]|uniref:hypothetical protein n=1 Tax=Catellatospora sp. NPDC049609 TaxID=3155505 RepID=UPI00343AE5E3